jgi:hypothetical protein
MYNHGVVRQGFAAVALVALGFSRDPGCGGVDDPDGGTNAPCTRSPDCGGSLVCLEGVCREPGSTKDAGDRPSVSDAGESGADGG